MKRFMLTAVAAVGSAVAAVGSAAAASACDPVYGKVVCYGTVYVPVTKVVPYAKEVVKCDECGKAYRVTAICHKEVTVEVPKVIEVVKYVKACG